MSKPHTPSQTPYRPPQARMMVRLNEPTLHDRDSIHHLPHGGDWFWLGLFALVALSSGAYAWVQTGLGSEVGRAAFFACVLLAILWTALIYTLKLSACVAVGPRGLSLVRGPWRTELVWAEVARLAERGKTTAGQHYRWLVAYTYDGRELRVREDMVEDYARFRLEVYERYKLWQDHGGTWGASGGGPFAAEEEVTALVRWWLIAASTCLLPGLYFALLIPETFVVGITLVALATLCALVALRVSLSRQTYTVDRRAVVARRTVGMTMLIWSEVTRVQRVRSRGRLLASVGILVVRATLALAARADSRVESFSWSPRVPEYLVLRAVGGRRIRMRLHRLARPDELLAWVEFYDRVAHQAQDHPRAASQPLAPPAPEPAMPDLGGAAGPADPWAGTRGGNLEAAEAGRAAPAAPPSVQPTSVQPTSVQPTSVQPTSVQPMPAGPSTPAAPPAGPAIAASAKPGGPRVTRPMLGGGDEIDPRILAVIQDVEATEHRRPSRPTGSPDARRGGRSDWLNQSLDQSPFPRTPGAQDGRDRG